MEDQKLVDTVHRAILKRMEERREIVRERFQREVLNSKSGGLEATEVVSARVQVTKTAGGGVEFSVKQNDSWQSVSNGTGTTSTVGSASISSSESRSAWVHHAHELSVSQPVKEVRSVIAMDHSLDSGPLVDAMLRLFQRVRSQATVTVVFLHPGTVTTAIKEGHADFGLVSYPEKEDDLVVVPWREEEMVVACSPGYSLAKDWGRVTSPTTLNGADFIAFDEDVPARQVIDAYLSQQQVNVNHKRHFGSIALIKDCVAQGQGVSILPQTSIQAEVKSGRLKAIYLRPPRLMNSQAVVYSKHRKLCLETERLLALLHVEEITCQGGGRPADQARQALLV